MDSCWASYRGDCSKKLSREHLVSKSLFESKTVLVHGFPWCKEEKEIGLHNLVTKNLCSFHNSSLSELDKEGASAWEIIKKVNRIDNQRKRMGARRWNVVKHKINGPLLERWFLKTLFNLSWDQPYIVGLKEDDSGSGNICPKLAKIAFGESNFLDESGLYTGDLNGQQIHSIEEVVFTPIIKDDKYILGGLFSFLGLNFFISLTAPPKSEKPFNGLVGLDSDWQNSNIHYHMEKFNFKVRDKLSQVILFNW
ncbi:MAG: hypothetical protein ACE5ER_07825 [Nitrospinaceae bacterium]